MFKCFIIGNETNKSLLLSMFLYVLFLDVNRAKYAQLEH